MDRGALATALVLSGVLMAFLALRVDELSWMGVVTLAIMTLLPLAVAYPCLRFLAKMEQVHKTPTPEMTFISNFAFILTIGMFGFVMTTLTHYY